MVLKQSKNPYGYRNLLVYKKAEEMQGACAELTQKFPKTKTLTALADQMDRSARSVKQNIVEGWKRNTTREYYEFLGFSIAANAELEEDCNDIWKGFYAELKGLRGIMGEKGEMGGRGEKGEMGGRGEKGEMGEMGGMGGRGMGERGGIGDIEKIPFYPLDAALLPVLQLKMRAKELNFLLDRLQRSLAEKMEDERTLPERDKMRKREEEKKGHEEWYKEFLESHGLTRLENGRVVKMGEMGEMGEMGNKIL